MDATDYRLDGMGYRVEEELRQAEQLRAQLHATRVDDTSSGGEVGVTVDSSGNLVGLWLTRQAMLMEPNELANTILTTTRSAQARLTTEIKEIASRIYGTSSESAEFITKAYTDQFQTQEDEQEDRGH